MKQKTEIVFEIEESVVVKIRAGFIGLCPECNRLTEMLTTETAAALSGLGEREIFRFELILTLNNRARQDFLVLT